ncbi:MAG: stage III sporulation protein AD [Syntrophomonadaceae bacterium]|nr:stage III sporulation protein AD [Syntrophomonadaceae bacterium]
MEIAQIVGLGLVTTIFLLIIRQEKPVLAVLLSLTCATVIFLFLIDKLSTIVAVVTELSHRAEANYFFLGTVLKILGVAYLAEFGAAICRDAGEAAVAKKVEFGAKIIIAVLALPIMVAILESLMEIMPR